MGGGGGGCREGGRICEIVRYIVVSHNLTSLKKQAYRDVLYVCADYLYYNSCLFAF